MTHYMFHDYRSTVWRRIILPVLLSAGLTGCYATTNLGNEELVYVADEATLSLGSELYVQYCLECHGSSMTGDGPKAETLEVEPANLRGKSFHLTQTSIKGVLDYPHYSHEAIQDKIKYGNQTMPPLRDVLSREEVEAITQYISYEIRQDP